MADNVQKKLTRVRAPRVSISYDTEIDGELKAAEIPFVAGVMANLSGNTKKGIKKLKNEKFKAINKENFDVVMQEIAPKLKISVEDKIKNDGSNMTAEIEFKSFADFNPGNLAKKIPNMKELMEIRQKLLDLQANMDGNEKLEEIISNLVQNPDAIKKLSSSSTVSNESNNVVDAEEVKDSENKS